MVSFVLTFYQRSWILQSFMYSEMADLVLNSVMRVTFLFHKVVARFSALELTPCLLIM